MSCKASSIESVCGAPELPMKIMMSSDQMSLLVQ
jgi:hypothetical protein